MYQGILREFRYLLKSKWDLCLVTLAPLCMIILFSAMFAKGKPYHLPIAILDQDQSELSQSIARQIGLNHSLKIDTISVDQTEIENLLNQTKIWGYITIPYGAEQRFVKAQDAQISIVYNQSYFSVGNTISSAMMLSTLHALAEFAGQNYLENNLPYLDSPSPHIKISTLYNPNLSYEFYLEPYMIPAILHLLLCCCVAFAVGQEFKFGSVADWLHGQTAFQALLSKNMTYVLIFSFWTWVWMFWLIEIRGWFVEGSLWLILLGQFLFYSAYAFISSAVVLATQDLAKSFGFIAVYGGSSLSFAGVTLPLNNAPLFTKFWNNIIPYTPYAKLQTEQWVVGSPWSVSIIPILALLIYFILYMALALFFFKKACRGVHT